MHFLICVLAVVTFVICASASILNPRSASTRVGTFWQRTASTWNDQSPQRDVGIAIHVFFLMAVTAILLFTTDDYHYDLSFMATFVLLVHGFLFRIPNGFSHWVEVALVVLDVCVVAGEALTAFETPL